MNKLDELIQWLHEAMETTENWTPPKAETDSLRLYLETHLVGRIMLCIAISVKDLDVGAGLFSSNSRFTYQKSL